MSHPKNKTENTDQPAGADLAVEPALETREDPRSTPETGQAPESIEPEKPAPAGDADAPATEVTTDLHEKAEANWDLYLRARADLENYRRRATRERQEAVRYASQGVVEKLLPVLDSFEKAAEATQQGEAASLASLREGIALVQTQLKGVLIEIGLQEIDAAGQVFDPNLHEAVAHQDSSEVADGHVLHQIRKGYKLHDRLVRPATVIVAKAPAA